MSFWEREFQNSLNMHKDHQNPNVLQESFQTPGQECVKFSKREANIEEKWKNTCSPNDLNIG